MHLLGGHPFNDSFEETGATVALESVHLLAPVTPSKILAVGRNYAAHVEEMSLPLGSEPAVFMKPPSSLLHPGGAVLLPEPEMAAEVEHEAELAVAW